MKFIRNNLTDSVPTPTVIFEGHEKVIVTFQEGGLELKLWM